MKILPSVLGLLLVCWLLLPGCDSQETRQVRTVVAGDEPSADAFSLSTTLCRKVSSKSGRRIGVGDRFTMAKKSYVRAFVDFANVKAERPYTVHLVWIRPDGREMFRKYAEVRQAVAGEEGFRTVIDWLDAEDLHKVRSDTLLSERPDFSLGSRLNTSLARERVPGRYLFRVYLDRGLLLEEPFTLEAGTG